MDECAQMGGAECWKAVNDFAFLTFEDCNYKHDYFLLPTSIKVTQEYTRDIQEQNKNDEFYERMRDLMSGFERKTLSFGSGMVKDMPQLCTHNCPTLGGTSGGVCLLLENQCLESKICWSACRRKYF